MTTPGYGHGLLLQQELRQAGLPAYLMRMALEILPSAITVTTVDLLLSILRSRTGTDVGGSGTGPPSSRTAAERFLAGGHTDRTRTGDQPEDGDALSSLFELWTAEGGSGAALARLLAVVEYRRRALPLERSRESGGALVEARTELTTFWISSGHDLNELGTFKQHVHREAFGALPK
ncbi:MULTISPECIES: hypothetical protein [unclassified Parafrankia]|uniref:hypothetical protein n=1 Tax=unclassified Parafrankia TaxID=2994368 RepID=UPI000DA55ABF|nr:MULTISPECIES: hypothetical protein [unclassified Parafrankia]TCJ32361.1 hypothetical protein E0504_43300 [Parafrankia sp. BMG5.11]CAI7978062.1 conserved hypothetical protein [Frankia sp. Hr75.2]SQD98584.1 hypothetical protein FMEAI12_4800006 [Parafrankia sp. Ea1.12]